MTTKDRCSSAIRGVTKHFASVSSLTLDGVAWNTADVETALQAAIDDANAADAARGTWRAAVTKGQTSRAKAIALLAALKALVFSQFGKTNAAVLADFGFPEPKPRKVSSATKAAGAQKAQATRATNGTTGKKAKKQAKAAPPASPAPATTPPTPALAKA